MHKAVCRLAVVVWMAVMLLAATSTADAEQLYPWCAYYSGLFSATNCGFDTLEQCRAAISGIGGMCQPNRHIRHPRKKPPNTAARSMTASHHPCCRW